MMCKLWYVTKGKLVNQGKKQKNKTGNSQTFFPCFKSIVKELQMLLVMYQKAGFSGTGTELSIPFT